MSKTSWEVKRRYNEKNYEPITLRVAIGQKELIKQHAKGEGKSLNAYIYDLIKKDMNIE